MIEDVALALTTSAPAPALHTLNDLFETERQLVGMILARPGAHARIARTEAAGETGLDDDMFPPECPYGYEEIMDRPIPWPPAGASL